MTAWAKDYWLALHPYSAGGAYVNFMMEEGQERVQATYRDNYAWLAQIKAKYTHTLMQFQESRVANTRPSRAIGDYAGTFRDSLYGDVIVRAQDGKLSLQMGRGQIADLAHWHYDSFLVTWRDPLFGEIFPALVTFTTDANAQVSALSMQINRDLIVARRGKP